MTNITQPLEAYRDLPYYEDINQAVALAETLSAELPAERKAKLNMKVKALACSSLQKISELRQQPSSTAGIVALAQQVALQIEHITGRFFEASRRTDLAFSTLRANIDARRGRSETLRPQDYQPVPTLAHAPRTAFRNLVQTNIASRGAEEVSEIDGLDSFPLNPARSSMLPHYASLDMTGTGKAISLAMSIPNVLVKPIDFTAEQIAKGFSLPVIAPVCEAVGAATRGVGHWIGLNAPLSDRVASSIVKVENAAVRAGNAVVRSLEDEGIPASETKKTGKNLVKLGFVMAPLLGKVASQATSAVLKLGPKKISRRLLPSDLGIDSSKGRVSLDGRLTKRGDLVTVRIDNIERLRQGNLGGIPQWLSALKSTARELGATEIEIRGGCVVNPKLLRQLTKRYNGKVTLSWSGNVNVTAKFSLKDTQVASLALVPAYAYADPFKSGLRARGIAERDLPSGVYSYFQQALLYEDRHVWSMRTKASTPSSKIKRLTADLPHFNKFLSSAQVHSFSGSMPGGKSLKANLLYTTVKGKPLYMIKNKIMSAHLIEKSIPQFLVTSKNMSWMERLYLIIQEVKQLNGSQRIYLAWDAKKLPVASLLELERANIAAIGGMSAGSGASPLTVLEVWWPE